MLEELADPETPEPLAGLATDPASDRLKLHVVRSILHARRADPDLFRAGSYEPVEVTGDRARHAFAFLRRHAGRTALVVVPRLVAGCFGKRGEPLPQAWESIRLELPADLEGRRWTHCISGEELMLDGSLGPILTPVPVGVLVSR